MNARVKSDTKDADGRAREPQADGKTIDTSLDELIKRYAYRP